jgi:DNA-binding CsgD family transcriptional regulator/tetratricopeptide (TPR) repeat protein
MLVGRQIERERLWGALSEARAGHPGVVLVAGEAGIGKTRLVADFEEAAAGAGARLLHGACIPVGGRSLPFGPIVDAFGPLFRAPAASEVARALGSARTELPQLLPGLVPGARRPPAGSHLHRGRLLELIAECLRRLAVSAPVVLVLEDLHWADLATLGALDFLARRLRTEQVLLLATCRTDEPAADHRLAALVMELDRTGRLERFELARLHQHELRSLVAGILGTEPDPELVAAIQSRSGGNPYFAEELLALDAVAGPLQATMREALLARIDGVAAPTWTMLRVAAVLGARFEGRLIASAGGLDERATENALREGVARHLLVPLTGPGRPYEFRHALLAEAVYEDLLPEERARIHAAIATTIALEAGRQPHGMAAAQLAHHWEAAGDLARALEASVQAGRHAVAVHANADAYVHYERALRLWGVVPDGQGLAGVDHPGLLEMAALAARTSGAFDEALEHLHAAISLVDPAVDPVRAGLLHEQLGSVASRVTGGTMLPAFREAVRLVPARPPTPARSRVLAGLARGLMGAAAWDEAAMTAREAIRLARRAGVPGIEADALATLGVVQGTLGQYAAALDSLRLGREIGLLAGEDDAVARAWNNFAWLLEGEAALRESLAAAEWDEHAGLGLDSGVWVLTITAAALFQLGRWDDADHVLDRALLAGRGATTRMSLRLVRGRLALGRGHLAEVERILLEEGPVATSHHDTSWRILASELGALLWLERGRPDEAVRSLGVAMDAFDALPIRSVSLQTDTLAIAMRAEADRAAGARRRHTLVEVAAARDRGAAILRRARDVESVVAGDGPDGPRRPAALAALCAAEWTRLDGESDPSAWAAAHDACTVAEQFHLAAYVAYRQAEAELETARDRAAATPLLRSGHEAAAAMGAVPLAQAAAALAARAGVDLGPDGADLDDLASTATRTRRRRRPQAPLGLTPREQQVLVLVAEGRTNREIGDALFISEGTAGIHVSSILGKLGASHRTEAAAIAHRLHLVAEGDVPPQPEAVPRP